jgi:pyruvate carboxylase subunit B
MSGPATVIEGIAEGKAIRIERLPSGEVSAGGRQVDAELRKRPGGIVELRIGDKVRQAYVRKKENNEYEVWIGRFVIGVTIADERSRLLARFSQERSSVNSHSTVRAPMPGFVSRIRVHKGDVIDADAPIIILEAMKMENEIRSPVPGKIREILVREGATVEKDQAVVTLDPV